MERAHLILIMLSLHLLGHLSQAQEDEVIFITGGHSVLSSTLGTSTEVLDISSSSSPCSRTTGDLPESRWDHSMDKMGDAILICGSGTTYTKSTSKSCVSSRNSSGPWLHHSTTNTRRFHSSAVADGRLHLLSGDYSGSDYSGSDYGEFTVEATLESLDEGVWTEQRLPYSIGRGSCSVQTSHDSFIVTGGEGAPRKTWEWKAGVWTELEEMKVERRYHACGTIVKGGKVFLVVAGGEGRNAIQSIQSSEVFAEGKWQDMGDLVKTRKGAQIVTVRVGGSQKMIIMGGFINGNKVSFDNLPKYSNSVEELVVNDRIGQSTWQLSEATMKRGRAAFGAVSVPKSKFCDN